MSVFFNSALAEDGKFLLAARKCRRPTCTDYIISLDADDMSKGSNSYVGKLRCDANWVLWLLLLSCLLVQRLILFSSPYNQIKFSWNKVHNLWWPATSCRSKDYEKSLHKAGESKASFTQGSYRQLSSGPYFIWIECAWLKVSFMYCNCCRSSCIKSTDFLA